MKVYADSSRPEEFNKFAPLPFWHFNGMAVVQYKMAADGKEELVIQLPEIHCTIEKVVE